MIICNFKSFGIPDRDGSFDNDLIIHEYTHGLSNRLVGGGANADCLYQYPSDGLGEGWSDIFAMILRIDDSVNRNRDLSMGAWAFNYENGIRSYLYSTSMDVNPQTFIHINDVTESHAVGAIWAEILYEVFWNLVDALGFTSNWFRDKDDKHRPLYGNTRMLTILIVGMKLTPCNPDFLSARDGILGAEELLGGDCLCEIWKGFAKRGLGINARLESDGKWKESKSLPRICHDKRHNRCSRRHHHD